MVHFSARNVTAHNRRNASTARGRCRGYETVTATAFLWPVALALVLTSCSAPSRQHLPRNVASTPSSAETFEPRVQRPITLVADASVEPRVWTNVLEIPFGSGSGDLGAITDPSQGSPNFPRSFAVGRDTYWILDAVKGRVAHYSSDGELIGELRGHLRLSPPHPYPIDLTLVRGHIQVLLERSLRQSIIDFATDEFTITSLVHRGVNPLVYAFVPHMRRPTAVTHGLWDGSDVTGSLGVGWFDAPGTGSFHELPGIKVATRWLLCCQESKRGLVVTSVDSDGRVTEREIRISLVRERGGRAWTPIIAVIDQVPSSDGLGILLQMTTDRRTGKNFGGRWYLALSEDGRVQAWERVPEPPMDDSSQRRHLTVDREGNVFLLLANDLGIVISKRT